MRPVFARLFPPCALLLSLLGCDSHADIVPSESSTTFEPGVAVAPIMIEARSPRDTTPHDAAKPDPGFVVHEWGTFTSMQSSTGKTLGGMYEEDEPLPGFVHRLEVGEMPAVKGMSPTQQNYAMLSRVTQRLETPVLYFYGDEAPDQVNVTVDFPQGIISEWYPQAQTYWPVKDSVREIAGGSMTWQASLLERAARTIAVPEDDIWAPSRRVDALTVQVGGEEEPLIFYRGVGAFTLPIEVESTETGTIRVTNKGDVDVPRAFLYKNVRGRRAIYPVGKLASNEPITHGGILASPSPKEGPVSQSMAQLKAPLIEALVEQGLYEKEAHAMVDTWERSYFETPGVRVLYIVPRAWTDDLLPIQIEPEPDELVRVLIGRIEVRSTAQEAAFEAALRAHFESGSEPAPQALGPLLMPKLQHLIAQQESSDPEFAIWLRAFAQRHHETMPVLTQKRVHTP